MRMLRVLLLLLMGYAAVPQAQAQFLFGARAGLNVSTFATPAPNSQDPRLGFHGGLTLQLPVSSVLFAQTELQYSQKGSSFTGGPDAPGPTTYALDYLDVPLLLGYALSAPSNLMVRLYAGPQISFKVSESSRTSGTSTTGTSARASDYGVVFGGDVGTFRVGASSQFGVGLRYTVGTTDIVDLTRIPDPLFTTVSANRHRVFSVSAYYTF